MRLIVAVCFAAVASLSTEATATIANWAYAANRGDQNVSRWSTSSGTFSSHTTIGVGGDPVALSVYTEGNLSKFLFVANEATGDENNVEAYSIDQADGDLVFINDGYVRDNPVYMLAVNVLEPPSDWHTYLFTAVNGPGGSPHYGVQVHSVDTVTGELVYTGIGLVDLGTLLDGPSPLRPTCLSADPGGEWLYVTGLDNSGYGVVAAMDIEPSDGSFNTIEIEEVDAAAYCFEFTRQASKFWGWLSVTGDDRLDRYSVDSSTGELTYEESVTDGVNDPYGIAYDSGSNMFVVNGNGTISSYDITNTTTGTIDYDCHPSPCGTPTPTSYGTLSTGAAPRNLTVDWSFGWVYVADQGTTTGSVSVFEIEDPGGMNEPTGPYSAGEGTIDVVWARTSY